MLEHTGGILTNETGKRNETLKLFFPNQLSHVYPTLNITNYE